MSEPEHDVEADNEQPDESDGDDLPEMEADEIADADLDELADEVEAEAGMEAANDADEPADDAVPDGEADITPGSDGESWGDMYVGTLTTVSNAIIDEHGTQDADQVDEALARQLHLDEYFDEWMASRGKSDMPPEQALLISTTMFLVVVVGTKTDLASKLMEEADF